jgi:NAD+ synthase (glutamine-hydrolysing)
MRVSNPRAPAILEDELARALAGVRALRAFDARDYASSKAQLLNDYMREHELRACVVAVSGGIDSAVVLALAASAARELSSPISRVIPVLAPIFDSGATNQDEATARGRAVVASCGLEAALIDLSATHNVLKAAVESAVGLVGEDWARGQLVAYVRTPAFYYLTSLLTQEGLPAILLGTTNRDEGAYLGYIGKAADGMVDVQLIADLHKSEVGKLARYLQLPTEVCAATPTGDMYDRRTDEEVFGAPYDFVELYLSWLCWPQERQLEMLDGCDEAAREQFLMLAARLEHLHNYNRHKYLGRSPAVHLNLLASAVPGGWDR